MPLRKMNTCEICGALFEMGVSGVRIKDAFKCDRCAGIVRNADGMAIEVGKVRKSVWDVAMKWLRGPFGGKK